MWNAYVALSVGTLLVGNHVIAPTGSFTTKAPSLVGTQPSLEPSGSVYAAIVLAYVTVVVKALDAGMPCGGVTMSLPVSCLNAAGAPPTSTLEAGMLWRSRLNSE